MEHVLPETLLICRSTLQSRCYPLFAIPKSSPRPNQNTQMEDFPTILVAKPVYILSPHSMNMHRFCCGNISVFGYRLLLIMHTVQYSKIKKLLISQLLLAPGTSKKGW